VSPDFIPFFVAGTGVIAVSLVVNGLGWISQTPTYAVLAISQIMVCIGGFITGNTVAASISGAAAGYLAWQWWSGGGGDDTKRRARKWARRFRGVRRTAPAGT
jgi:hypothetical protein